MRHSALRVRQAAVLIPLVFLALWLMGEARGFCAERVYYSIHLASFRNLKNANAFVNSLKEKGKLVFWKETEVPGKGKFYRVYLGKYKKKKEAVAFWKKLDAEGAVSYFGVHRFTEPVEPAAVEKAPVPPKPAKPAKPVKPAKPLPVAPIPMKERFVDNGDGTVTDRLTGLMWIKNGWRMDFVSAVPWEEAKEKVKAFRLGGYTDWRLPTLKEWKSLIDTSRERPALVEPNPFENVITHMPYWSQTEFTFDPERDAPGSISAHAYVVMLYFGRIGHQNKSKRAFILPVRTLPGRGVSQGGERSVDRPQG